MLPEFPQIYKHLTPEAALQIPKKSAPKISGVYTGLHLDANKEVTTAVSIRLPKTVQFDEEAPSFCTWR